MLILMRLLPFLTCLFHVSSVLAANIGIEISPSSVIAQPISTLDLRATSYSSIPNCDITSYTWSTIMTPIPATATETSSQPIFTTPNDRITSITGLTTLGTYIFQLIVTECTSSDINYNSTSLPFRTVVVNQTLVSDFFVIPPTIVTTPGFVFPPTLPPTLPPTTSTPTIPVAPTTPPVDPSVPGPTDPNTGAPVDGGQQPQPQPTNPPIVNAGKGGSINTNNNSNSFNIMYVIIPAAVVAGLLLIGICLYCRRSQIPVSRTQSSSTSSIMIGAKISQPFEAFTGANQLTSPV